LPVTANFVLSGVMRTLMDKRHWGPVSRELIDHCLQSINKPQSDEDVTDQYTKMLYTLSLSAHKYLVANHKVDSSTTNLDKLRQYQIYGHAANQNIEKHYYHEYSNNENAFWIHDQYRGVIERNPKFKKLTCHQLDRLLCQTNLDNIKELLMKNPSWVHFMTCKKALCAIVTNGTSI